MVSNPLDKFMKLEKTDKRSLYKADPIIWVQEYGGDNLVVLFNSNTPFHELFEVFEGCGVKDYKIFPLEEWIAVEVY